MMKTSAIAIVLAAAGIGAAHAADMVVRIGHVAPLTGSISHLGKDNENGALLAIEDYNAKGVKIDGKTVEFQLIGEDDQADPRTGTTVAQRLADAEVAGVIGHLNSGTTIPASRIYHQAGIPMISPSATNPKLTQQNYEDVFRTIANDVQQGSAIGKFATGTLGARRIAIIDDRTAYGQGLADEVEKAARAGGASIVAREFTTDKATDFNAILTKIRQAGPEAIFFGGMDAQGGPMLRQLKQLGIEAKFITGDGGCTTEIIKLAGGAIDQSAYCTQAGLPLEQMPGGKDFKERYKKRFGLDVQIYAPYAYDAASALIEAMIAADSVDPEDYLPKLKAVNFPGVTGTVAFDDKGDIKEGAISVYQFRDGQWQPL